ncbi:hypothetical protein F8388_026578 [Cannabis sativa]|uniref:Uncharacterized protein n=1 Tax=Cannabis sativa TaxID=3483 RepID=A0A7J6EA47_CANSA|nr:hypothetical protein F8388_026578 [Cannabis sativa]
MTTLSMELYDNTTHLLLLLLLFWIWDWDMMEEAKLKIHNICFSQKNVNFCCPRFCDMSKDQDFDCEDPGLGSSTNGEVTINKTNSVYNGARRAITDRFFRGNNRAAVDDLKVSVGGDEKREHGMVKKSGPLLSGIAYCISSCSMILLNKVVLSGYNFNAESDQFFSVILLGLSGAVSVEKLNPKLIRVWIPVNVIFVEHDDILTAIGELYIFRKHQNQKVWNCNFFIDYFCYHWWCHGPSFDGGGYAWQIANFNSTAVMDEAKKATKLFQWCYLTIYYLYLRHCFNSLFGEWEYVMNVEVTKSPLFWVVATASGFLGLAISFTSMWFLHQTGLFAGVLFARAKIVTNVGFDPMTLHTHPKRDISMTRDTKVEFSVLEIIQKRVGIRLWFSSSRAIPTLP